MTELEENKIGLIIGGLQRLESNAKLYETIYSEAYLQGIQAALSLQQLNFPELYNKYYESKEATENQ